jgi:hypothetical protein
MFIQDLAHYLEENSIGTVGTNLFIGDFPADIKEGMYLVTTSSPAPDTTFNWEDEYIDFYSLYCNDTGGYDILLAVKNLLHQKKFYEVGNYLVCFSNDLGTINDLDKDSQNRKIYMLSIRFIRRIK